MYWKMRGHKQFPGWNAAEVREGNMALVFTKENEGWRIAAAHNTDSLAL